MTYFNYQFYQKNKLSQIVSLLRRALILSLVLHQLKISPFVTPLLVHIHAVQYIKNHLPLKRSFQNVPLILISVSDSTNPNHKILVGGFVSIVRFTLNQIVLTCLLLKKELPMPPLIFSYIIPPGSPDLSKVKSEYKKPIVKKKRKSTGAVGQKGISAAVCHASPNRKLTKEQGRFIQAQLLEALDNTPKEDLPPRFLKSFFERGVFWMVCADENTRKWLIRNVQLLSDLREDINLKVETKKIPQRPIIYLELPELERTVKVLDRLATQNPELCTDSWVILSRQMYKSGQRMTFSVDTNSFEFLKSQNFTVPWKLQTLTFKANGLEKRKPRQRNVRTINRCDFSYKIFKVYLC